MEATSPLRAAEQTMIYTGSAYQVVEALVLVRYPLTVKAAPAFNILDN
jgi:hypothetical protein